MNWASDNNWNSSYLYFSLRAGCRSEVSLSSLPVVYQKSYVCKQFRMAKSVAKLLFLRLQILKILRIKSESVISGKKRM